MHKLMMERMTTTQSALRARPNLSYLFKRYLEGISKQPSRSVLKNKFPENFEYS